MKILLNSLGVLLTTGTVLAGPYAPAANQEGTTAVSRDSASIVAWASRVESYFPAEVVGDAWKNTRNALGPAEGRPQGVVVLGPGGSLTASFGRIITNGPGDDLAVFENSFSHNYLELAYVEVSSNGFDFVRFPSFSETPPFSGDAAGVSACGVDGLAGKYIGGFGTPFDLSDLPIDPLLDLTQVRFVRIVDVIGAVSLDSLGRVIYDPQQNFSTAGFDLDGIALLERETITVLSTGIAAGNFTLSWQAVADQRYRVEASSDLSEDSWEEVAIVTATSTLGSFSRPISKEREFLRVVAL